MVAGLVHFRPTNIRSRPTGPVVARLVVVPGPVILAVKVRMPRGVQSPGAAVGALDCNKHAGHSKAEAGKTLGYAVYDLSGTGKKLGVLTEIPPLWFAGA
jgi:hypothetical protein